jgi:hypothetical protein
MRDESYIDYDALTDSPDDVGGSAWRAAAAAVVSLCLLALLVVWAYRLGVRDAHDVPVIRAMVEQMRIAPEDPGGLQVAHQERQVYDLISGDAADETATATLAPPPEALEDEDLPMAALAPETVPEPVAAAVTVAEPAIADAIETTVDDLVARVLGASTLPDPIPGAPASPLPALRPARGGGSAAVVATPAALTPARPAIQLGAYLSRSDALSMWDDLAARNGDLLAGRDPVVSELVGTSRTLYGLRAVPFATSAEASGLCAALRARNEDCLVTEIR